MHTQQPRLHSQSAGFQESNVIAVGGKLGSRHFWVAENYVTVDQRWGAARFASLGGRYGVNQRQSKGLWCSAMQLTVAAAVFPTKCDGLLSR